MGFGDEMDIRESDDLEGEIKNDSLVSSTHRGNTEKKIRSEDKIRSFLLVLVGLRHSGEIFKKAQAVESRSLEYVSRSYRKPWMWMRSFREREQTLKRKGPDLYVGELISIFFQVLIFCIFTPS